MYACTYDDDVLWRHRNAHSGTSVPKNSSNRRPPSYPFSRQDIRNCLALSIIPLLALVLVSD